MGKKIELHVKQVGKNYAAGDGNRFGVCYKDGATWRAFTSLQTAQEALTSANKMVAKNPEKYLECVCFCCTPCE